MLEFEDICCDLVACLYNFIPALQQGINKNKLEVLSAVMEGNVVEKKSLFKTALENGPQVWYL